MSNDKVPNMARENGYEMFHPVNFPSQINGFNQGSTSFHPRASLEHPWTASTRKK